MEDKEDKGNEDRPLYYTPRLDELPESAPDIAFLLGEGDAPLPLTAPSIEGEKPVRVLHDWAVFDARPSKVKDDGGALALALISLHALDGASDGADILCAPEGAGAASPFFENEEDAGQEDDGDYDDDSGDEEEGRAVSLRLRLGALLRYTIDYTKRDEYVCASLLGRDRGTDVCASAYTARYTSRRPRRGTSSVCPPPRTARSTPRSSVRTRSRRYSCAPSCATFTPPSTLFFLSFSS